MTDKIYTIDEIKAIIKPIAEKYGIKRIFLFGSYSRGEQTPESDLDFVIEKGKMKSLIQLSGFRLDLVDSFQKEIDVITTRSLENNMQFHEIIKKDELIIYEQR